MLSLEDPFSRKKGNKVIGASETVHEDGLTKSMVVTPKNLVDVQRGPKRQL